MSQSSPIARPEWNDRYINGDLPWEIGEPDSHLVEFVRAGRVPTGRALDIGCGAGTQTVWLAEQGFDVTGIDLSPVAIEIARKKGEGAGASCHFIAVNFLTGEHPTGPFDFVFDRGCFHGFDANSERTRFAERVSSLLTPDGLWLSLIGSTEGGPRDHGPPRRTARDVALAIEPHLEIVELRTTTFRANIPSPARAWVCVARRRMTAAQPPTGGG